MLSYLPPLSNFVRFCLTPPTPSKIGHHYWMFPYPAIYQIPIGVCVMYLLLIIYCFIVCICLQKRLASIINILRYKVCSMLTSSFCLKWIFRNLTLWNCKQTGANWSIQIVTSCSDMKYLARYFIKFLPTFYFFLSDINQHKNVYIFQKKKKKSSKIINLKLRVFGKII